MPDREKLNLVLGSSAQDLRKLRIPGIEKPFEELTISELTQLRPGGPLEDTYEVNAVTDNVSVTTSALLHELGKTRAIAEMKQVALSSRLREVTNVTNVSVTEEVQGLNIGRTFWGPKG